MDWLTFALIAPLFSTATNFIDKYLIGDRIKNPQVLAVFMASMGLIAGTIVWLLNGQALLSTRDTLFILAAGIIQLYSWVYYFKGLEFEETSIVILLFQISPIMTLMLSWLFLGEAISFQQFMGFILILSASTAVSLKGSETGTTYISQAFWDINIANLLWSISAVMLKFTINTSDLLTVLPYEGWGLGLGGLILIFTNTNVRNAFVTDSRRMQASTVSYLFGNEIIALASRWITVLAFSLGPVALVDVVVGIQVFYGIAIGWLLTWVFPKIFDEDMSKKGLLLKIIAALTLFYGLFLIR